jgi:trimethylamine--corrinoid protein Co-methyltransferase
MTQQPSVRLLDDDLIGRILDEAFQLMLEPGIKIQNEEARLLLQERGAYVTPGSEIVRIPQSVVRQALATVPSQFHLYDLDGNPAVCYGGDTVQYDPGSCGVNVLDPHTCEHRPARTADLIRIVKVAEMLPQIDAQSTAVVCHDVSEAIGDLYRLYIVLMFSRKPIVTGAFSLRTVDTMIDMLALMVGGADALRRKPRAVFDACPSPPLIWSKFGAGNLIALARAGVPAEIVSMPLAGAVAPVTLLGTVTQHAAECLSGIAIHQAAAPGSPIVWGGAPAVMDMRKGSTPMAAIETAMIDSSYAQVGKSLNIPTHTYLGTSDAKIVDAQAGLETGMTALIGALSGINMISGAGMLAFLTCFSAEKLVLDAEAIAMTQRLLQGMKVHTRTLATELFAGINFKGDFLKQRATRELFAREQYLPSPVIDRDSMRGWEDAGSLDAFSRARSRVGQLLAAYTPPPLDSALGFALREMVESTARQSDIAFLPPLP